MSSSWSLPPNDFWVHPVNVTFNALFLSRPLLFLLIFLSFQGPNPTTDPAGDPTPLPLHPEKTGSSAAPQPSPLSTELLILAFLRLFISPKPHKSNFINVIRQAARSAALEAARQRERGLLNGACGRPSPALFLPAQGPAQSPPLPSLLLPPSPAAPADHRAGAGCRGWHQGPPWDLVSPERGDMKAIFLR